MRRWSLWLVALVCTGCRGRFDEIIDGGSGVDASWSETGDPSAVKLITKHVFGAPGSQLSIAYTTMGDVADLELDFVDPAFEVVYASAVVGDAVTLPATAGVYRVELRDRTTGGLSYGQATVSMPVTDFTSVQQLQLNEAVAFAPSWPNLAMVAADLDGDGAVDLSRVASKPGAVGLEGAGVFVQSYSVATGQLGAATELAMPEQRICGIAVFDEDGDGDHDLIVAADRPATYEFHVCVLRNHGSGTFGLPECRGEIGTAQDSFSCYGGLAAGDFNRDGHVDLAVSGGRLAGMAWTASELRLLASTPAGFVTASTWRTASTQPLCSVAVADVNDDGRLDVLANGTESSRLHTFTAGANFTLADPALFLAAHGAFYYDTVVPAYIDGNATLDVMLVHPDGPSSVFYSDGQTLTPTMIPTFTELHAARFHVLDLDVDGAVEVIIPYMNRYLATNRVGAMRKTVPNLTQTVTPSASNSILGMSQPGWTVGNYVFADWDRDGRLDTLTILAETMDLEVLRGL